MNKREKEIIAWALATEGNFSVNLGGGKTKKGNPSYIPRISFANTDKGLVEKVKDLAQCGTIYSRDRSDEGFKPGWDWVLSGIEGCLGDFLERIIPYLPAKKRQAELVLEFCRIRQATTRKGIAWKLGVSNRVPREEEIYMELKELNRKGVKKDA